jgi:hypothetical protein
MNTLQLILISTLALIVVPNFDRARASDDGGLEEIARPDNQTPAPPQLPRNFQWKGRYIVSDLVPPVDVPFTLQGNDGNGQMTAGGEEDPIHFTNLLYDGELYTKTYQWPCSVPPESDKCVCLGRFTLDKLNACLRSSRYVGAEILKDKRSRHVNHFRISVVFPIIPPPDTFTSPIMEGDFYVDENDSSKFWKVLHFGLQNLLDPALDEWIVMQKFKDTAGEITPPEDCDPKSCPDRDAFPASFVCK